MALLPLYYFNIGNADAQAGTKGASIGALWAEIQDSIDSLQPVPKKMYNDGIFTFNNRLIVILPPLSLVISHPVTFSESGGASALDSGASTPE